MATTKIRPAQLNPLSLTNIDDEGTSAALDVGTTANTVCAGDDSRLANARSPDGTALASASIWIGDVGNLAAAVAVTGDVTITNAGVTAIGALNVTNAMLANGSIDLTAKVTGILPIANGGTNASTEAGARTALGLGTIATAAATDYLPLVGGTATTFVDLLDATRAAITKLNYTIAGSLTTSTTAGIVELITTAATLGTGGVHNYYGKMLQMVVPTTNTDNLNAVYASLMYAYHRGTGTLNYLYGTYSLAVQTAGAGAVGTLVGAIVNSAAQATSGVTNQTGLHIAANRTVNTGTTTDRRAINISALTNTGTITDTYGIYIGSQTGGTQTNLPFSIYSSDAGAKMYHAGNVGIGTTSPGAKLSINGGLHVGGDSDPGDNNALVDGTLNSTGNFTVGANKFVVTASTGALSSSASLITSAINGSSFGSWNFADNAIKHLISLSSSDKVRVDNDGLSTSFGGEVGIGIAAPTSKLHVVGDSNLGGFVVSSAGLVTAGAVPAARITGLGTIATAAATDYLPLVGGTATTFVDPVGATRAAITRRNYTFTGALVQSINIGLAEVTTVSGDGSAYYGRFHWHTVPATSSANHTTIIAEQAQTNHYGTGTVNYLYGCSISASQQAGAGAVTYLYGAVLSAYTVAASGVTNQWGLHIASNRGAAGTTTDRRVINISALSNSGTITDTYGIYIGSQTAGTQTNLPFSIYSVDANAKMYHAGNVGIGTTSPAANLHINSTIAGAGIRLSQSNSVNHYTRLRESGQDGFGGAFLDAYYDGNQVLALSFTPASNKPSIIYGSRFSSTSKSLTISIRGGADVMTFDNAGNVGIGTTGPGEKLYVMNEAGAQSTFGGNGSSVFASNAGVGLIVSSISGDILRGYQNTAQVFTVKNSGNVGIGITLPTAVLHLKAGTATADTAPLKLTSGTNLTTAAAGAVEYDGTQLYFSPSTTRNTLAQVSGGTALATGSIPFATTSGYLAADSDNLFWNRATSSLRLGKSTNSGGDYNFSLFTPPNKILGTVSTSALGTTVTGVSTTFLSSFVISDLITINGETRQVLAIASDTSLTTTSWTGANSGAAYTRANYGVGTITTTSGSGTITGSGTNFLLDFAIGNTITCGGETRTISAIASASSMTTDNWTASNAVGSLYISVNKRLMAVLANGNVTIGNGSTAVAGTNPYTLQVGRSIVNGGTGGGLNINHTNSLTADAPSTNIQNFGILSYATVGAKNTRDWTNSLGIWGGWLAATIQSGATGTISTMSGVVGNLNNSSSGATITTAKMLSAGDNFTNSGTITNTYGVYVATITGKGTQTNTPFSFYASDPNAYNYFAGNVGIGTTSPGTKLDMTGTLRTTGIGNALSGAGAEIAYNGSVGYFITYNRSLGATYSCHFGGDGATGIRVDTVGNVGIGIVIPTSKLHVVGDSNLGGFIVSSAGLLTAGTVPAARVTGLTNLEAIYNSMMN